MNIKINEGQMMLSKLINSLLAIICICSAVSCSIGKVSIKSKAPLSESSMFSTTDSIFKNAALVDEFLTSAGVRGGVLIAHKGKVVLNKGYGWANEDTKVPITSTTIFNIGSVTKQFTGAGILKLEEQGKVKTTDLITKFFDNVPADKTNITIHHLLTHTAGFVHDAITGKIGSRNEAININISSKLRFNPGERFAYSNTGYQLLAAIIEIASGVSYEQYLRQNLWDPAGMLNTGNLIPKWQKNSFVGSYDISGDVDKAFTNLWGEAGISSWNTGAGGIHSTLEDLYKWHLVLNGNKILSVKSKQKLFTPYILFKAAIGPAYYAYGWAVAKTKRGTTLIEHNGGNGYNFTDFYRYVDEDVAIIYFTNERHTLSLRILDSVPSIFFGKPLPAFPRPKLTLTESELKNCTGLYELPSGKRIEIELINKDLTIKAVGSQISKLLTTFPKLNSSEQSDDLQILTAKVMESIAKGDIEQVRELIDLEGTFEEEKSYWKRTFATWSERFGAFKKSEVIGTISEKNFLNTYALILFENGATVVQYRRNEQKKFYIGHPAFLLPKYYRFIPQSKTEFVIYNYALQTTTPVVFDNQGGNIIGLTISNGQNKVYAKKIL